MALLAVGPKRLERWWTFCLVGVILLLIKDARAQIPDNTSSPCSHFRSVCHVPFWLLPSRFENANAYDTIR